jgi:hypothetical protein
LKRRSIDPPVSNGDQKDTKFAWTGTNIVSGQTNQPIPLSDPESLKAIPGDGLVLTSGAGNILTLLSDLGTKAQSERFVTLTNLPTGSSLDDVVIPTSSAGTFYVSGSAAPR